MDVPIPCGFCRRHSAPWWPHRGAAALAGWGGATGVPAVLPGVGPKIYSSSVPKGGHTEFPSRVLGHHSQDRINECLGVRSRTVLQTPSSTHNQPFLGWTPRLFASAPAASPPPSHAPHDLPGHIPRGGGNQPFFPLESPLQPRGTHPTKPVARAGYTKRVSRGRKFGVGCGHAVFE